jgi:hypothetical protein
MRLRRINLPEAGKAFVDRVWSGECVIFQLRHLLLVRLWRIVNEFGEA